MLCEEDRIFRTVWDSGSRAIGGRRPEQRCAGWYHGIFEIGDSYDIQEDNVITDFEPNIDMSMSKTSKPNIDRTLVQNEVRFD